MTTPNQIKELIKQDDEYVVGSLLALYEQQTIDEQSCQSTMEKNNIGFNAVDANILSDISKYYLKRKTLSTKQIQLVRLKLYKYTRQLAILGVKPKKVNKALIKEGKKKERRITLFGGNRILFDFPFDREIINKIKAINGWYYKPDTKEWTTPLTIQALKLAKQLDFVLDEKVINWFDERTKGVTANISIPGLDGVLRDFQKIAVSFIETRGGRVLIADSMGLGKTLEVIAWMVLRKKDVLPALIVCPATLKLNWQKEIKKWTDWGEYTEILHGKTPYEVGKPIAVINYDILFDWMDYLIKEFKPILMVGDECHLLKAPGSKMKKDVNGVWKKTLNVQRSYAFEKIAKKAKYVLGLTGTPFLNKPKEIFNPLKIIKPSLFPNFKRFGYRYCNPHFNGWATVYEGASNVEELNKILVTEVMIRRTKEQVLSELPPKSFSVLPLEPDNMGQYNKAEEDFIEYLTNVDPDKVDKAKNAEALVQINYLRRLAVDGKMKQSIEWIENFIENEPLVVFAWHTEVIDFILNTFSDRAVKVDGKVSMVKRQENIELFSKGKKDLFIGQIAAAGQGVDGLQKSCSNMAFIEYPWSPGLYNQAGDRLYRIGQNYNVMIWNLIAVGTIEEQFLRLLETKSKMFDQVIDGKNLEEDPSMFTKLIADLKKTK